MTFEDNDLFVIVCLDLSRKLWRQVIWLWCRFWQARGRAYRNMVYRNIVRTSRYEYGVRTTTDPTVVNWWSFWRQFTDATTTKTSHDTGHLRCIFQGAWFLRGKGQLYRPSAKATVRLSFLGTRPPALILIMVIPYQNLRHLLEHLVELLPQPAIINGDDAWIVWKAY